MLKIKRVYDPPSPADGKRILIDRLWPRGLRREDAHIHEWRKDVAPSSELRKWFGHDPKKWDEFRKRFFKELQEKRGAVDVIVRLAQNGTVSLVYGSREERFNNAVALKEYIESKQRSSEGKEGV